MSNLKQNRFKGLTGGRAVKYLLGLLVFLVIADGLITNLLVNQNIAREGNPLLGLLAGKNILVIVKIIGAAACAFILWDIYKHWTKLGLISVYSFTAVYTLIVTWNLVLLLTPAH